MQRFVWILLLPILVGCAGLNRTPSPADRLAIAEQIAGSAGFTRAVIGANPFPLLSYQRGEASEVTIYVEGDGLAWASRTRRSSNPTPTDPLALRLAVLDPSPAVAYLARPCQYVVLTAACSSDYWTNARFAEEVIAATDQAIEAIKAQAGAERIHLVGYSGGGAVAALVAVRRDDVASLRTVAGYLDHVRLNEQAGVSPLTGSLDPMRAAPNLSAVPQLHFVGREDRIIPSWVAGGFMAAQGERGCALQTLVPDVDHASGWSENWAYLLERPFPNC